MTSVNASHSITLTSRELSLLNQLLQSLNSTHLDEAGMSDDDINTFAGVFFAVRDEAETL